MMVGGWWLWMAIADMMCRGEGKAGEVPGWVEAVGRRRDVVEAVCVCGERVNDEECMSGGESEWECRVCVCVEGD